MNWISLTTEEQLVAIIEKSVLRPQLIYKHSIRCGISTSAKNRLEKAKQPAGIDFYYLDLINYRAVSNKVSEVFKVQHESPQILLIREGKCVYHESHIGIMMEEIELIGV